MVAAAGVADLAKHARASSPMSINNGLVNRLWKRVPWSPLSSDLRVTLGLANPRPDQHAVTAVSDKQPPAFEGPIGRKGYLVVGVEVPLGHAKTPVVEDSMTQPGTMRVTPEKVREFLASTERLFLCPARGSLLSKRSLAVVHLLTLHDGKALQAVSGTVSAAVATAAILALLAGDIAAPCAGSVLVESAIPTLVTAVATGVER